MSVFRERGFKAHQRESERRKEEAEKSKNSLWQFFLKDGDEDIPIRFLTEEPILFYQHSIKQGDKFTNETCEGEDCHYCSKGNKPSYKGAWLIVDGREFEYKDKEGKDRTGKDQVRLYVRGSTDIAKIDRLNKKFGLTNRPYYVTKTGEGTSTSYELDRGEESELTRKELQNILSKLPEKFRDHADADDEETLYDIVEHCIFGDVIEDEEEKPRSKKRGRDYDDEEEDEDIDEGVRSTSSKKIKPKSKIKKPSSSGVKRPSFKRKR